MNSMNDFLKGYKLNEDIPKNVRHRLFKNKRNNLVRTLKTLGIYNSLFGFVLYFYFGLRAIGLSVSLYQSIAVAVSTSLVTAGAVSTGTYIVVKKVITYIKNDTNIEKPVEVPHEKIKKEEIKKSRNKRTDIHKPDYSKIKNKIVFYNSPISGDINRNILARINNKLKKELLYLRGPKNLIISGNSGKDVKYMLTGTIDEFNNNYTINARVINKTTSKIIYGTSVDFKKFTDIDKACKKIAVEISRHVQ